MLRNMKRTAKIETYFRIIFHVRILITKPNKCYCTKYYIEPKITADIFLSINVIFPLLKKY